MATIAAYNVLQTTFLVASITFWIY